MYQIKPKKHIYIGKLVRYDKIRNGLNTSFKNVPLPPTYSLHDTYVYEELITTLNEG